MSVAMATWEGGSIANLLEQNQGARFGPKEPHPRTY